MKTMRTVVGAVVAVGVLTLVGCAAADSELGDLETELAGVAGVNSATATVSHPGAPWNTEIIVTLFLENTSDDAVLDAVRGAAPVLAAEPEVARHRVSIGLLEGEPADYPSASDRSAAYLRPGAKLAGELGIEPGRQYIVLSPDHLARLAGEAS